jgi:hypothetical protein
MTLDWICILYVCIYSCVQLCTYTHMNIDTSERLRHEKSQQQPLNPNAWQECLISHLNILAWAEPGEPGKSRVKNMRIFFSFVVLRFEVRASHFLGKRFITWATPPAWECSLYYSYSFSWQLSVCLLFFPKKKRN